MIFVLSNSMYLLCCKVILQRAGKYSQPFGNHNLGWGNYPKEELFTFIMRRCVNLDWYQSSSLISNTQLALLGQLILQDSSRRGEGQKESHINQIPMSGKSKYAKSPDKSKAPWGKTRSSKVSTKFHYKSFNEQLRTASSQKSECEWVSNKSLLHTTMQRQEYQV